MLFILGVLTRPLLRLAFPPYFFSFDSLYYVTLCFSLFFLLLAQWCSSITHDIVWRMGVESNALVKPIRQTVSWTRRVWQQKVCGERFLSKPCLTQQIVSPLNSCLAVSLPDNICISNAQYYELNAQQNLWCEILEFWACSDSVLTHSWLYRRGKKCAMNTRIIGLQ